MMPTFPLLRHVLVLSIALRVGLILYSEWHDAHSVVKYTDIDYRVFSDAARFMLYPTPDAKNHAQGPLKALAGLNLTVGECAHLFPCSYGEVNLNVQSLRSGDVSLHTAACVAPHAERMASSLVWQIPLRRVRYI